MSSNFSPEMSDFLSLSEAPSTIFSAASQPSGDPCNTWTQNRQANNSVVQWVGLIASVTSSNTNAQQVTAQFIIE